MAANQNFCRALKSVSLLRGLDEDERKKLVPLFVRKTYTVRCRFFLLSVPSLNTSLSGSLASLSPSGVSLSVLLPSPYADR